MKIFMAMTMAGAAACSVAAQAAEYPVRPIRMIVPQAPGSASDTVARLLAAELSPRLGQQVVVDNRPGGALMIGMEMTARAAPDGYTIGYAPVGGLVISPNVSGKPPYDSNKDFAAVIMTAFNTMLLASNPNFAVKNVRELIDYAKANPGKLSNASSGNGTPGHVGMELFKLMTNTQIMHIPYKGGAAGITATISGEVQLMMESLNSITPNAKAGRVRALGVTGSKRAAVLPDVPTIAEAGLPGFGVDNWQGLFAPPGVARKILLALDKETADIVRSKEFADVAATQGAEAEHIGIDQFAAFVRKDHARWKQIIDKNQIRGDS